MNRYEPYFQGKSTFDIEYMFWKLLKKDMSEEDRTLLLKAKRKHWEIAYEKESKLSDQGWMLA